MKTAFLRTEVDSSTLQIWFSTTTFKSNILFYFQVPFVEALDLVRSRKVYLENVSNKET